MAHDAVGNLPAANADLARSGNLPNLDPNAMDGAGSSRTRIACMRASSGRRSITSRPVHRLTRFRLDRFEARLLFGALFRQMFDQDAPLAAAGPQDDDAVGSEAPRQGQAEERRFVPGSVGESVRRLPVSCSRREW